MTRRRGSYLGGSTLHIPGRDSGQSEAGPPQALARAQDRKTDEIAHRDAARSNAAELYEGFRNEAFVVFCEVKDSKIRDGSSLTHLKALNWQERLEQVAGLARLGGDATLLKSAQRLMGRLVETERGLQSNARAVIWDSDKTNRKPSGERFSWDTTVLRDDSLYWSMALSLYRR